MGVTINKHISLVFVAYFFTRMDESLSIYTNITRQNGKEGENFKGNSAYDRFRNHHFFYLHFHLRLFKSITRYKDTIFVFILHFMAF